MDDLMKLYRKRKRDLQQAKTKRRRATEMAPARIGELLGSYFGGDPEAMRRIEETRAIMAWEGYVGSAASRVSQAIRVRGDQLVVRVKDPLWMQQLSWLKQELIKKYAHDFPKLRIKEIFFTRN